MRHQRRHTGHETLTRILSDGPWERNRHCRSNPRSLCPLVVNCDTAGVVDIRDNRRRNRRRFGGGACVAGTVLCWHGFVVGRAVRRVPFLFLSFCLSVSLRLSPHLFDPPSLSNPLLRLRQLARSYVHKSRHCSTVDRRRTPHSGTQPRRLAAQFSWVSSPSRNAHSTLQIPFRRCWWSVDDEIPIDAASSSAVIARGQS